jgi:hypothetical protein
MPSEREVIRKVIREVDDETLATLKNMECESSVPDDQPMKVLAAEDSGGIDDSILIAADCCKRMVWISPSTQEMMTRRGRHMVEVVCVYCFIAAIKELG